METSIIRSDMLGGGRRYDVAGPNDAMVAHRDALEAKESGEEAREKWTDSLKSKNRGADPDCIRCRHLWALTLYLHPRFRNVQRRYQERRQDRPLPGEKRFLGQIRRHILQCGAANTIYRRIA